MSESVLEAAIVMIAAAAHLNEAQKNEMRTAYRRIANGDAGATTTKTPSHIVRYNEIARRLGVCKMTARKLIATGQLVAMRLGNRVIGTTAESLENFIARGTMAQA